MKGIFSIVSVAAASGLALAQDAVNGTVPQQVESAPAAPATAPADAGGGSFSFKNFMLDEDISFFDLGSNDITLFNTRLSWELEDRVDINLNLPVYTNGDTGLGMVGVGVDFAAIKSPTTWIDAVTIGTGIELPAASDDFGGDSINTKLGAGVHGKTGIDRLSWCAGVDGTFVSDATFLPVFGGLVFDDVFHLGGGLHYNWCDGINVALKYNYWDVDSAGSISTLGPTFNFDLCPSAKFEAGFDVPVSDDNASELDLVVRAGFNVKF